MSRPGYQSIEATDPMRFSPETSYLKKEKVHPEGNCLSKRDVYGSDNLSDHNAGQTGAETMMSQ